MKSARDRDRTRLAGGPATSQSGWQRLNYTGGSAGHRQPLTTFRLRFPEGWLASPEAQPGPAKLTCCAPAPGRSSPASFPPKINFVWASSYSQTPNLASERLDPRSAPLPPGCRPVHFEIASDCLQYCSGALLEALQGPECPGQAESAGLPARVGGVWAPGRSAGGEGRVSTEPRGHPPGLCPRVAPNTGRFLGIQCPQWRAGSTAASPLLRSRRRGLGARRVRVGCRGAIGSEGCLRSSATISAK